MLRTEEFGSQPHPDKIMHVIGGLYMHGGLIMHAVREKIVRKGIHLRVWPPAVAFHPLSDM